MKVFKKILKYLAFLFLSLFFLMGLFFLSNLGHIRQYYQDMSLGRDNLQHALNLLQEKKYLESEQLAEKADQNFKDSLNDLDNIKQISILKNYWPLKSSIADLSYFTKTTAILAKSLVNSLAVLKNIDIISQGSFQGSLNELSTEDRRLILTAIYQATPELNGLRANLQLALNNLDQIHEFSVLFPIKSQISNIKEEITLGKEVLDQLIPLTELIPVLSGYPQQSEFLFLLQNNDELRPSGGFIGTYGVMKVKDGKAEQIITEDVYHLDMPCIGKLFETAPAPITKYMNVENWWLRDANWSPDFPSTARKVAEMFVKESTCAGKEELQPDAVIAINPDLIANLISLVGPIQVGDTLYNAGNFQTLLQYNVEMAYRDKQISSWDRKEIINDLVSELEKKLLALPAQKVPEILNVIKSNIAKKNIQVYFANTNWQKIGQDLNLSGEVKKVSGDYLMVVDANLAAFKSDSVMKKDISYQVSSQKNSVFASLKLNYKHEGGFDWRTTRYRSYTRVYAPLGTVLVNSSNLDDFSSYDDLDLDKTVFAFFWSIEPGQENNIELNYRLPTNITASNYRLYFQKQSGSRLNQLTITTKFNEENNILWQDSLDRDRLFE